MHRRNILATALAAAGALVADGGKSARAEVHAGAKAVYHLSDLDKAGFVLGNIDHHLEGAGGPSPETARKLAALVKADVKLNACVHSMRGQNVTLKDLLPGFAVADKGGVVLIAELQGQGYVYLRP